MLPHELVARYAKEETVEVSEQLFDAHVVLWQQLSQHGYMPHLACAVHARPESITTSPRERRGYYHFENLLGFEFSTWNPWVLFIEYIRERWLALEAKFPR